MRIVERMAMAHAGALALMTPALLGVLGLRRSLILLDLLSRWHPYRHLSVRRIRAIIRRRLARPRVMIRRACLRHGLVLYHFLRLIGLAPRLHLAVYPPSVDPRRLHGHCWVGLDGKPLLSPPSGPAAEILTWPTSSNPPSTNPC